jgi:hypothetical protein
MSKRKKNKNKYKNKTYSKPVAYSYSSSKDIKPLAFQVFGSLYYTSQKQS